MRRHSRLLRYAGYFVLGMVLAGGLHGPLSAIGRLIFEADARAQFLEWIWGAPLAQAQVGACVPRDWVVNVQGVAKACIAVSNTAATVLGANGNRCGALVYNNSANGMSCTASVDGDPTTTAGMPIIGGASWTLGTEAKRAIKCIRLGGSDALACVAEWMP